MSDLRPETEPRPVRRPVVLYDERCPICRAEVDRLVRLCGGAVEIDTLQSRSTDGTIPDEMKLETPDGRLYGGAEAVARALVLRPVWWAVVWLYFLPGLRQIADAVYRWVAANRYRLSAAACPDGTCRAHAGTFVGAEFGASPALMGIKPTYRRSAKIFWVMLGIIYAVTFASALAQIHALVGSEGLLPLREALDFVRQRVPDHPYRAFPTLFWVNSSDAALTAACVIGLALSACVIVGLFRRITLPLMMATYISITVAGQSFYAFQWDNLQIEAGVHAMLLPAYSLVLFRRGSPKARAAALRLPHAIAVFMMHWLLFRLYFASGVSKVLPGARGWLEMWAMDFYYDTAPLPTWIGWYAHNMPRWWHQCEVVATLAVELLLPVFIFAGRRLRHFALVGFTATQLGILLTANYGIFNYLSLALGVFLLEDRDYDGLVKMGRWMFRRRTIGAQDHPFIHVPSLLGMLGRTVLLAAVAAPLFAATMIEFGTLVVRNNDIRRKMADWRDPYTRLRLVDSYHLFAGMTTERVVPEIQGLDESGNWVPYLWRWAPQDPQDPPRFAAPHHPRLDFQIWFSTLSDPFTQHTYLLRLVELLCARSELAGRYFNGDPFRGTAPRSIRVVGLRFNMTDPATRSETGDWWKREPAGELLPQRPCAAYRRIPAIPAATMTAGAAPISPERWARHEPRGG